MLFVTQAPGLEAPTRHLTQEPELAQGSIKAGTRQAGLTSDSQGFGLPIGPDRRVKSEQKITNEITGNKVSSPSCFPVPLPILSTLHAQVPANPGDRPQSRIPGTADDLLTHPPPCMEGGGIREGKGVSCNPSSQQHTHNSFSVPCCSRRKEGQQNIAFGVD